MVPAEIPRCVDRISHVGKLYLFLPLGLVQSVALAQKTSTPQAALPELHCNLRTYRSRVVLQSDSSKPWHPSESGVRLTAYVVFPLKTWEAVSWDLEDAAGSGLAVCGVDPPSL